MTETSDWPEPASREWGITVDGAWNPFGSRASAESAFNDWTRDCPESVVELAFQELSPVTVYPQRQLDELAKLLRLAGMEFVTKELVEDAFRVAGGTLP